MYVVYVDRTEASHKGYRQLFDLSPSDLGPFQHYNLKEYLDIVDKFELEFTLQHHLNDHVPVSATCFDWTIRQRYNYGLHGAITVELDVDRGVCSANTCDFYLDDIFRKFMWLNLSVLICAFLSFSLTCHYLYTQTVLMSTFKHKRKSMAIAWDNLSLQEKFKFIDM